MALFSAACILFDYLATDDEKKLNKDLLVRGYIRMSDANYSELSLQCCKKFVALFDRVYGPSPFSIRFILTSIISSVIASFFLFNVWAMYSPNGISEIFPVDTIWTLKLLESEWLSLVVALAFWSLSLNCTIDYLSLIQTRYFLRLCSAGKTPHIKIILAADVIFTASIFFVITLMSHYLTSKLGSWHGFSHIVPIPYIEKFDSISDPGWLEADSDWSDRTLVLLSSTYFTSVFFYLYFICHCGIKILSVAKPRVLEVIATIEKSDHTYKSFGIFVAAILAVSKALLELFRASGA